MYFGNTTLAYNPGQYGSGFATRTDISGVSNGSGFATRTDISGVSNGSGFARRADISGALSDELDVDASNSFDYAYTNLLNARDQPIYSGMLTDEDLTNEDTMCNTNLHTASLFKDLNEKYKHMTRTIDTFNDTIKDVQESSMKIEKNIKVLKDACLVHYTKGLDTIQRNYTSFNTDIVEVRNGILESLIKKRDDLEIDLENITRKLNALRKLILTGVNEIIKPEDIVKKMCPICFDREVCMAYIPCGHTYCRPCSDQDRTRYARCPQCREVINSRVKIYFSI